ncbi:hypothetical protein DCAR_0312920 [Daucus carota subsp. sativus]|uniref:Uncharacterized protein n=1 Tax=Daucus carota subsp. sativus TaxID=79200 RepID=A0A161WVE8_DAUCS|nr:hypothetical protein DCAR_0312920 [Daucus carota subsp. sativus]
MRHSKPASSVQEVPKVTAPGPDRPSSVQAFHDGAAAFYATTVASPTLHPYMGRRQLGDQDYANLGLPQEEERVLDEERTEEAFTIHQSQLLKHRTIEDMFFSNNNINQLMIFQTSKSSRCRSKCVRFKQVRFKEASNVSDSKKRNSVL